MNHAVQQVANKLKKQNTNLLINACESFKLRKPNRIKTFLKTQFDRSSYIKKEQSVQEENEQDRDNISEDAQQEAKDVVEYDNDNISPQSDKNQERKDSCQSFYSRDFIYEQIKNIKSFSKFIFDHLQNSEQEAAILNIIRNIQYEKINQGEYVFKENDASNNKFYIIFRGYVSVVKAKKNVFYDDNLTDMADEIKNNLDVLRTLSDEENQQKQKKNGKTKTKKQKKQQSSSSSSSYSSSVSENEKNDEFMSMISPEIKNATSNFLNIRKASVGSAASLSRRTSTADFQNMIKDFQNAKGQQADILMNRNSKLSIFSEQSFNVNENLKQKQPKSDNIKLKNDERNKQNSSFQSEMQKDLKTYQSKLLKNQQQQDIRIQNSFSPEARQQNRHNAVIIQPRKQKLRKLLTQKELNTLIVKEGFKINELGPEDSFGEIALLAQNQLQAKRTASIFCQTDAEFLVIMRKDFINILRKYDDKSYQKEQFLLKYLPLLKKVVNVSTLQQLCYSFKEVNFYKGKKLAVENMGSRERSIYLIVGGRVSVSKRCLDFTNEYFPKYLDIHLSMLEEGCLVGEEILFNQNGLFTYTYTIESSDAKLYEITRFNLFSKFPKDLKLSIQKNYQAKDKQRSEILVKYVNKQLEMKKITKPQKVYEQFEMQNQYDLFDSMNTKMKKNVILEVQQEGLSKYLDNGLLDYDSYMRFNSSIKGVKGKIFLKVQERMAIKKNKIRDMQQFKTSLKGISSLVANQNQIANLNQVDTVNTNTTGLGCVNSQYNLLLASSSQNLNINQQNTDDNQNIEVADISAIDNNPKNNNNSEQSERQAIDLCIRNQIDNAELIQRRSNFIGDRLSTNQTNVEQTEQDHHISAKKQIYLRKKEELLARINNNRHKHVIFDFGHCNFNIRRNQVMLNRLKQSSQSHIQFSCNNKDGMKITPQSDSAQSLHILEKVNKHRRRADIKMQKYNDSRCHSMILTPQSELHLNNNNSSIQYNDLFRSNQEIDEISNKQTPKIINFDKYFLQAQSIQKGSPSSKHSMILNQFYDKQQFQWQQVQLSSVKKANQTFNNFSDQFDSPSIRRVIANAEKVETKDEEYSLPPTKQPIIHQKQQSLNTIYDESAFKPISFESPTSTLHLKDKINKTLFKKYQIFSLQPKVKESEKNSGLKIDVLPNKAEREEKRRLSQFEINLLDIAKKSHQSQKQKPWFVQYKFRNKANNIYKNLPFKNWKEQKLQIQKFQNMTL